MRAPRFWQDPNSFLARTLLPAGRIYNSLASGRIHRTPDYQPGLPVICVGNVTMGGSGKTPVVQALVSILEEEGKMPAVLLRGYGGTTRGPTLVDMNAHDAATVGDEAILHGAIAPTVVSSDRVKGAKEIEKLSGVTHILMDDGLQNPSLKKDVSFLVIDGENPFGNALPFPAGPLREKIEDAVKRVQAIIVIGEDRMHLAAQYRFLCPVFRARLKAFNPHHFAGRPVVAFAGIGRPEKFFHTLEKLDAVIIHRVSFADHHAFSAEDVIPLLELAERVGARLVTTRKDWVRLPKEIQPKISVLDVRLEWEDKNSVKAFLIEKNML